MSIAATFGPPVVESAIKVRDSRLHAGDSCLANAKARSDSSLTSFRLTNVTDQLGIKNFSIVNSRVLGFCHRGHVVWPDALSSPTTMVEMLAPDRSVSLFVHHSMHPLVPGSHCVSLRESPRPKPTGSAVAAISFLVSGAKRLAVVTSDVVNGFSFNPSTIRSRFVRKKSLLPTSAFTRSAFVHASHHTFRGGPTR